MTRVGTGEKTWEIERRHIVAGAVAFVLSIGIHLAFFLFLAGMDFRFLPRAMSALHENIDRSIKLLAVLREPPPEEPALAKLAERAAETAPSDLAAETEGRQVEASEDMLRPPSPSEKWLAGIEGSIAGPGESPDSGTWEARQEILAIEDQRVAEELGALPRKRIPRIPRFQQAPDIVLSASREDLPAAGATMGGGEAAGMPLTRAEINREAAGGGAGRGGRPETVEPTPPEALREEPVETPLKAVEKLLIAEISTYTTPLEPRQGYFRIEIRRAGSEELPVIPKDIVLVQDCSASIATQRLYFCKVGWLACLPYIQPKDRFNVIGFRDRVIACFDDWAPNSPEAVETGKRFVADMTSEGETDIFLAVQKLLDMQRTPGRPMVAFVVTDARPTAGLVRSSDIIGKFSKMNDGGISVFAMGTIQTANEYLLDLLGYSNRGAGTVNTRGRWAIPDLMQRVMAEIRRPVLADLRFRFATGSGCEVFPDQTENLYLDRTLVLYGRYPRETTNVVFQAVGQAADVRCDMVFNLGLQPPRAKVGGEDIRTNWAKQRIYYLIAEYARNADPAMVREILDTGARYGIRAPYRDEL